jgi:hypothetical protein
MASLDGAPRGVRLHAVEPAPALNASRPTALRLWGFVLLAVGALVAGYASVLTWVTVGLRQQPQVSPEIPGLDTIDGKIVLAAAVVMLVGVIATRMVSPAARKAVALVVLVAAIVVIVVAGAFLVRAPDRFEAVDSDVLVEKIAEVTDQPADTVRREMEQVVAQLGGFTDVGPGPWVALGGGILAAVGGILLVAWSRRTAAATPAPSTGAGTETIAEAGTETSTGTGTETSTGGG